jgi:hypothetical protein
MSEPDLRADAIAGDIIATIRLVAEPEVAAVLVQRFADLRAAERERCARVCDERRARCQEWEDTHLLEEAAAAIRALT